MMPGAGARVGPWELDRLLGSGGMAQVWLAHRADGAYEREVALKLPLLQERSAHMAARFAQERGILASLEHPNIARMYDAGADEEGHPYLAMELVQGLPIGRWCDERGAGPVERIEIFLQVLDAVRYAHGHGVLHRDLKPSNILVTAAGRAMLLDFGVARLLAEGEARGDLTRRFGPVLTPGYASPEQMMGEPLSPASDVYALGIILHELLTGLRPGTSTRELQEPLLHGDLSSIVERALLAEASRRYPGAGEFADDLRRYLRGEPIAVPGRPASRLRPWHALALGVGAAFVLSGVAAVVFFVRGDDGLSRATGASAARTALGLLAPPLAPPDGKSIAVLPFLDLSPARDQEHFSDGLSEELIDRLSRSAGLKVIARTSSFRFRGHGGDDARSVAAQLGVAHLLEGSVQKTGALVRISVELVRAADGTHVWSQTYERQLGDIFRVQEDIASSVANSLRVALLGARHAGPGEDNAQAYNAMLQGQHFFERNHAGDSERSIAAYRQALELEPRLARAWASLARAYSWQGRVSEIDPELAALLARDAAGHALAGDPASALAHRILGNLAMEYDWDWDAAAREFEQALLLDPAGEDGEQAREALLGMRANRTGENRELVEFELRRLDRNPVDTDILFALAGSEFDAGHWEEAAGAYRRLLELDPAFAEAQAGISLALLLAGKREEALAAAQRETSDLMRLQALACAQWSLGHRQEADAALERLEKEFGAIAPYDVAEARAWRGENGAALDWLEKAYAARDANMATLRQDPLLRALHGEPRFRDLAARMKLADPGETL